MRLNRATAYAVQAVIHMARDPIHLYASHNVARAEGIPERFLLKVLKPLVSAGMLHSVRGPNGGYRLAKPAKSISVLEVMEATEGPIHGQVELLGGREQAPLLRRLGAVLEADAQHTRQRLGRVSIAELAGTGK